MSDSTIIWRGNRRTRALMVNGTGKRPVFYLEGDVVPEGTISEELVERYVADGRMERVIVQAPVQHSIATEESVLMQPAELISERPVSAAQNNYSIATEEPIRVTPDNAVPHSAPRRKFGPKKKKVENED